MVDNEGIKFCYKYEYEHTPKNNKEKKIIFIYFNKQNMKYNLTNEAFTQYFADATYH